MVEEDGSALPKKDSRLLLAKFNEQLQPLYELLREVEDIKLSPECLEPEPVDIETIRGMNKQNNRFGNEQWSGEATRNQGFAVEEARVDVTIGGSATTEVVKQKDRPVWMTESTINNTENIAETADSILQKAAQSSSQSTNSATNASGRGKRDNEDIMSVLLLHEKQPGKTNATAALRGLSGASGNSSDSSEDEREIENTEIRKYHKKSC